VSATFADVRKGDRLSLGEREDIVVSEKTDQRITLELQGHMATFYVPEFDKAGFVIQPRPVEKKRR